LLILSLSITERVIFTDANCTLNATLAPYNQTMGEIRLALACANGTAVIDLMLSMLGVL
jgi:hypothetical protein